MFEGDLLVRKYLRVSHGRSGTGKSPNQQHEEMRRGAQARRWRLHPHPYRDDGSASRYARKKREDFEKLIRDLETGNFGADVLGIWESSRGSRLTSKWLKLIDLCKDHRTLIWVLTHNRVYDPANARDRRTLREDASDAEYESDKTSERLRRDTRYNAEQGRPHGKQLYGYRRAYDQQTRQLIEVVEHPDQALAVKEAASRVLAGESFYALAKDFNNRGIPPRRKAYRQQRQDKGWTSQAIKQMLSQPAYAGKRQHRGEIVSDAIWPTLIPPDTWQKLQVVMDDRNDTTGNDAIATHLLTGIAVCGVCGAGTRMGKQDAGKKQYKDSGEPLPRGYYKTYLCHGAAGNTGFHVAMKMEHLDTIVTDVVLRRLERPDFLAYLGQLDNGVDIQRQALITEIEQHQQWLEQVHVEAERRRDLRYLTRQEDLVLPKIRAAQTKLESLAGVDPIIFDLVKSGQVRQQWQAKEKAGDFAWRRHVIRAPLGQRLSRRSPHSSHRDSGRERQRGPETVDGVRGGRRPGIT